MTYYPFQTYSATGAYPGLISPLASPYGAFQTPAINPMAAWNPISGIHPQQLQLAQILAARAVAQQLLGVSPFTAGLQNPQGVTGLENPFLNPLAQFQQPQQIYGSNPHAGQFGMQGGHAGLPYLQAAQGLAPQSWVGQPSIHPLVAQQLAGRGLHAPWMGF
jgi:hypothetical protein